MSRAPAAAGSLDPRFRRGRWIVLAVVTICLAQIGWWIFFQVRDARRHHEQQLRLGATLEVADDERAGRVRMAVAEGSFLAIALAGGVVVLYWFLRRELRREHEQNQMLAAVSHDFRTPLTAIKLVAQTLELDRAAPDERPRMLQALRLNTSRLEELVENVLVAARLHAGKLTLAPVDLDLADLIVRCVATRSALLESRAALIETRLAPGLSVRADATLLQSVVGNLIDNALRFSPEEVHLTLTAEAAGDQARVTVTDRGIGFDPSTALALFERFHRAEAQIEADPSGARAGPQPGLGLGLWLAREIVRLHGGSIAAHSAGRGTGATFLVTLPLVRGARAAVAPAREAAP